MWGSVNGDRCGTHRPGSRKEETASSLRHCATQIKRKSLKNGIYNCTSLLVYIVHIHTAHTVCFLHNVLKYPTGLRHGLLLRLAARAVRQVAEFGEL